MQGSSGDADIGNRLVDTMGEGEDGMNWESIMETCITMCKIDSSGNLLLYNSGSSYRGVGQGGRWEGASGRTGHMYPYS